MRGEIRSDISPSAPDRSDPVWTPGVSLSLRNQKQPGGMSAMRLLRFNDSSC